MKRFVFAGVAAVALAVTCQGTASAHGFGFSVGVSVGVNFSCSCAPCCAPSCAPSCAPTCWSANPCYGGAPSYGYYAPPVSYAGYAGAGYGADYQTPPAPSAAAPQNSVVNAPPTVQPIGYYYSGNYGYGNYGYYQAPNYWYGR